MRSLIVAFGLTVLTVPAAAHPLGSAIPRHPSEGSAFQGRSTGEMADTPTFHQHRTAMQRLQQMCGSSIPADRRSCKRAWREINAAYAQLQAARQSGGDLPQ